ncbi:30S ribosome-binding factor RbfA [Rhodocytophaga rosea]|uniref:Ribosome-binding factor A n=1 Tax=Rhodocytophaga rosea TaxID=2704465 RepID=A0A6C0GGB0_9BACT|nr:30S ribosome-binding factor RbfA [Rhodocytophaga rosea]QHT66864.1 30S ribosome-binding factor RbfA [Rhodocytophaga rosea]
MESKRQQKFARLIQKDLSEIFQRDAKSMFNGAFITVTEVKVSPDLSIAKVYLSFLLAKNKNTLIEDIKEKGKAIRQMLAVKIKNQARIIPELHFYLDESLEYAAKIDNLLSKIHIPPATEEDENKTGN